MHFFHEGMGAESRELSLRICYPIMVLVNFFVNNKVIENKRA